ncbi:transcription initiation factor IIA [Cryptosporidium ubiquitum]|uniref:Transcription initiation factor IIA n=1 Tax=Cryptosporidium ubiquitum TaxID=857276 RepID=A0A1J4MR73_9CRYT|nr:transcription initiation factor IIA [Cryptosporidium ubiquitum]OII75500.1 transcription initiation factor IIA [Cryptosporidium ubiquitum]
MEGTDFSEWLELNIGKSFVVLLNEFVNNGRISPIQSAKMIENYIESCSEVLNRHVKSGRKLKCEGTISYYNCIEGKWDLVIKDLVIFGKSLGRVKSKYVKVSGKEVKDIIRIGGKKR